MERRHFLSALPAVALLPLLPSVPSFRGERAARRAVALAGFNHVELAVSSLDRSIRFYQEVFGTPIQSRTAGSAVLRLGRAPRYLAIRQVAAGEAPAISRLGLAVAAFDPAALVRELAAFGVTDAGQGRPADIRRRVWREPSGGLFMGDSHGILVQLVDRSHCGGTGPLGNQCGPAQPSPTPGSLSLLELNHFTVSVSDATAANAFWQETFGASIQAYQANSPTLDVDAGGPEFVMFIGGGGGRGAGAAAAPPATPPPPTASVNHVCFTIPSFNVENTFTALARHGIERRDGAGGGPMTSYVTLRMPNRGGAEGGTPEFYFLDPDGLLIQLQDATYCGGAGYLGEVC